MSFIWIRDLIKVWLIIIGALALGYFYWWTIPLVLLIIGNRQHALAILGHEGTHKLICKNQFVNYWSSNIFCFLPIALAWNGYKKFHFEHHKWLGTDKDPELEGKKVWGVLIENRHNNYVIKRFVKDYFFMGWDMVRNGIPHISPDTRNILIFNTLLVSIILLINWHLLIVLAIWYGALISSFIAFVRLRVWFGRIEVCLCIAEFFIEREDIVFLN